MSLITWNKAIITAGLLAATLSAQTNPICGPNDTVTVCNTFDGSGNAMLNSTYFVREVELAGVALDGTAVNTSFSLSGIMTFDGNGNYTFTGQELVSPATAPVAYSIPNANGAGTYQLAANGVLGIVDPLFPGSVALGEIGAAGPAAFVASRPSVGVQGSGNNIVMIVGIPISASTSTLNGAYYGSYFDFHQASVGSIREAWFPFNSTGSGNLGTLTVTGAGTDLGNTVQTQQLPGVGYSFAGNVGTINFGGAGASSFVSGSQTFYVSNDGSLIVGGSAGDYDLLAGIQALGGTVSNASLKGIYFLGGIQDDASIGGENIFEGFSGSTSATGQGASITHREISSSSTSTFQDTTTASTYTIPASGVFSGGDRYQYALGANGTFIATGQSALYSVVLGLQPPASIQSVTGSVWLNPLGIVNAANSAPVTNPVAPNEIVTLYGQGMAAGAASAPSYVFPLPTSLNGVQVYVNGTSLAPLLYVSPTVINLLSPSKWYPNNGWGYVTFQVCVGSRSACDAGTGSYSNPVRVFTQNSAPGVFDLTGSATGTAAVLHASDGTFVNSGNPAHAGEIVEVFATGLGITANQPDVDGSAGVYSPLIHAWQVWMGGVQCDPNQISNYAGLAPGYAGLYQINVTVPSGTAAGDVPLEVWTTEGETIETTINIAGTAGAPVR